MEENRQAVAEIIDKAAGEGKLDTYDRETLKDTLGSLYDLMETYQVPDMLLYVVYVLVTKLTPVSSTVADRFVASGLTLKEFISSANDPEKFADYLAKLLTKKEDTPTGNETPDKAAVSGLWARLAAFFKRLREFFEKLFNRT